MRGKSKRALSRRSKPEVSADLISEQSRIAKALCVNERTFRRWRQEPTFPDCSRGFSLDAIRQWVNEQERSGSAARLTASKLQTALKREKVEQEKIKTRQMQLRLAEDEKELLPRETLERALAVIATKSGDALEQLPDLVRGICAKKDRDRIAERLKQELDKWRTDLCAELESLGSCSS